MGLEMPFGDGLNDAIGRSDRNLSGMGLKMLSGMVIESCWRWACRCHPRMFVELYVVGEWVSIRKVSMFGTSLNWGSE